MENSSTSDSDGDVGSGAIAGNSTNPNPNPSPARRSFYTHSSRSHPNLPPGSAFFPPFYNRPPTPLPPSPSLTSLLRPSSFSAHTSRPTSPDSSEVEHGRFSGAGVISNSLGGGAGTGENTTATSTADVVAKSARTATTVPRASPNVPTYEYYGFALYVASSAAFLLYLLWAYLPSPFLHRLGLYYYPNRWWALAIPAWLVIVILYIYVALASYNTRYLTRPLCGVENVVDEAANVAVVDAKGDIVRQRRNGVTAKDRSAEGSVHGLGSARREKDVEMKRPQAVYRAGKVNEDARNLPNGTTKVNSIESWAAIWSKGTDAVLDVPIGGVCEVLYGGE